MSFAILFFVFLMFILFAWQEAKEGKGQWAAVFVVAGFLFLVMALVSRY